MRAAIPFFAVLLSVLSVVHSAAPITPKDIALLVRMGWSEGEILAEVEKRRLIAPLDATAETNLKASGAGPSLIEKIKAGNFVISGADAATAASQAALRRAEIERKSASASEGFYARQRALTAPGAEPQRSKDAAAAQEGSLLWKKDIKPVSPFVVGPDGTAYIGLGNWHTAAYDADGGEKWRVPLAFQDFGSVGPDGTIYTAATREKLYAINPDGSKKWELETRDRVFGHPTIGADGTIYACLGREGFVAINPDGSRKWISKIGGGRAAIGADGTIYLATADDTFSALTPDGKKKWDFNDKLPYGVCTSPSIAPDGTIYFGADKKVIALTPEGKKRWETAGPKWRGSSGGDANIAVGVDGTIYLQAGEKIVALNPDATKRWEFPIGNDDAFVALGEDGTIYVAESNHVHALNPNSSVKWKFTVPPIGRFALPFKSMTLSADGIIYLTCREGFYAVRAGSGLAKRGWPALQRNAMHTGNIADIAPRAPALAVAATAPAQPAPDLAQLKLTGISAIAGKRMANISANIFAAGDEATVKIAGRALTVKCVEVREQSAVLSAGGVTREIFVEGVRPPASAVAEGTPLWMFGSETERVTASSPTIAKDGTIFLIGTSKQTKRERFGNWTVFALNPDGSTRWSNNRLDLNDGSSPAIGDDGTIYFSGHPGLCALAPDGAVKWKAASLGRCAYSPALAADGSIFFPCEKGLAGVNADGSAKSSLGGDTHGDAIAIAGDGTIYAVDTAGTLRASDPAGKLLWEHTVKDGRHEYQYPSSPAIGADGTIYYGGADNKFYAVEPDGRRKWFFEAGAKVQGAPVIGPGETIYVGSHDDKLYALTSDGAKKWEFRTGGDVIKAAAVAADGTVYFGSADGKFYALGADGAQKWVFAMGHPITAAPAIGDDGTVYVVGDESKCYALKGGSPLARSAWPMFRHDLQHTARSPFTAPKIVAPAVAPRSAAAPSPAPPQLSLWQQLVKRLRGS